MIPEHQKILSPEIKKCCGILAMNSIFLYLSGVKATNMFGKAFNDTRTNEKAPPDGSISVETPDHIKR